MYLYIFKLYLHEQSDMVSEAACSLASTLKLVYYKCVLLGCMQGVL